MKAIANIILIYCLLGVLAGIVSAQASVPSTRVDGGKAVAALVSPPVSADDRYRIGFQDVLDIQIFRHPELAIKTSVSPNGTIFLFRLEKPIIAVCKTERELANDIEAAYRVNYLREPQVNVVVTEQKSQSMSVIGAVEKPGSYFVSRKLNLLQLLALAGGPNKESGTRMIVARAGSTSNCKSAADNTSTGDDVALYGFKIRDIQEGKKNLWMQPGDVVSVLDADLVYVYGNVIKQGVVKVTEPITLTQAIAAAEGLKPATDKSKVRILRQKPDSLERDELPFNLADIEKGTAKDPYLEANDIIAITKDRTKDILMGIGTSFRNGIPSILTRVP